MALRAKNQLVPNFTTQHLLLMNGVDHLEAQDNLSGILKAVNELLNEDEIIHSTFPKYVQALKETHGELATITGELREDRNGQILAGTLSSRMYLKQENEKSQTLLEKYAEPAFAVAWVLGNDLFFRMAVRAKKHKNDRTRSDTLTICRIVTDVQLRKDSPMVEFTTEVTNTAKDHRLRVLFPSGIQTDVSHAEGQFDVLTRPLAKNRGWHGASPFYPQQAWVNVNDGEVGLTIINKGLPEYELYDDAQRTLALTLLRCVGRLSGGGESPAAQKTPDAQCLGTYTFQYAMLPHAGTWESAQVWQHAHRHNVPVRVMQTAQHDGKFLRCLSFVRVTPGNLVVSAIKKAERADSIIVRLYNTTDETIEGMVKFATVMQAVNLVNLNEEFQRQLATATDILKITVAQKQIVTLEVRR